ncbi:MAG: hypothetical protein V4471_07495 [Pseudomonadota bacterium]
MAKEIWQRELLKHLQEENRKFSKKTEAFLAYISTQDFSTQGLKLLQEGIAIINTLPQAHPISLCIKKQQEALFKHMNGNEALGRFFPNTFSCNNATPMALLHKPYSNLFFSSKAKDVLIDSGEFIGSLLHLCAEPTRLKNDQAVLNEAIDTLLREDDYNENDYDKEFNRILEQCREKENFFNNFKNYIEIVKETHTLVKEYTLQSNELANTLKTLVNNKQWDNKAIKLFVSSAPDGVKKIRAILSNSVLSHDKIIDIVNIVKQKIEQPRYLRTKSVSQLYQQLSNVLKQHCPNLYIMENNQLPYNAALGVSP